VLLSLRAQPRGRREDLRRLEDGRLKVVVTEAAEKGKANRAVIGVLARRLGFRPTQLQLVAGAASRDKTLLIRHARIEDVARRIEQALGSSCG
jgi:hypothetical protein